MICFLFIEMLSSALGQLWKLSFCSFCCTAIFLVFNEALDPVITKTKWHKTVNNMKITTTSDMFSIYLNFISFFRIVMEAKLLFF
jgi:hypothetical protein